MSNNDSRDLLKRLPGNLMDPCQYCGKNQPGGAFCMHCGKKLAGECTACGKPLPSEAQFCLHCGFKLPTNKTPVPAEQSSSEPTITFLVAGLRESARRLKNQKLEQTREELETAFNLMSQEITSLRGRTLQYSSNGMLACFQSGHHELQACFAAARMQKMIASSDTSFHLQVGIHSAILEAEDDQTLLKSSDMQVAQLVEAHTPLDSIQISYCVSDTCGDYLITGGGLNIMIPWVTIPLATFALRAIKNEAKNVVQLADENDPLTETSKTTIAKSGTEINNGADKTTQGERKLATNFFIRFETTKNENNAMTLIINAIHRYDGTIIRQGRNNLFAVFGAPVAFEDHPLRACLAAHNIQQQIFGDKLAFNIYVGIHAGEVIMDEIGGKDFHQYEAIGSAVNLAEQLMQTAESNQIQLSASTRVLVDKYTQTVSLGTKRLKGFEEPLKTYSLSNLHYDAIHKRMDIQFYADSIFFGREKELRLLNKKWERALSGQEPMLAIKAEAGMGKTRLLYEFSQELMKEGATVYSTSASAYERKESFFSLRMLLGHLFSINPTQLTQFQINSVLSRLKHISFSEELAPQALLTLLGSEIDDPKWIGLASALQQKVLFKSICELLESESKQTALLIILEDLHWCDNDSLEFIRFLTQQKLRGRLFLVVNYRPEFNLKKHIGANMSEMTLKPLPPDACQQLLMQLLPGNNDLTNLRKTILRNAEGNPFFIEEYVKAIFAKRAVIEKNKRYSLSKEINIQEIPKTIQGMVSSRIDQLPAQDKRLLQQASILGRVFPVTFLRYFIKDSDEDFRRALNHLEQLGFISETALVPEPEFTFKHAYILDAVYDSMLSKTRELYHEHLVSSLESDQSDNLVPFYPTLGHHAYLARLWTKALNYYNLMMPSEISVNSSAAQHVAIGPSAKNCFENMNKSEREAHFPTYGRVMLLYARSLYFTLCAQEAFDEMRELIYKATTYNNLFIELHAKAWYVAVQAMTGHATDVHQLCQDVLSKLDEALIDRPESDIKDLNITAYCFLKHPAEVLGHYDEFDKIIAKAREMAMPLNFVSHYNGVSAMGALEVHVGLCYSSRARLDVLEKQANVLEKSIKTLISSESLALSTIAIFCYYYTLGDLPNASKFINQVITCLEETNILVFYPLAISFSSAVLFHLGHKKEALARAQEGLSLYEKSDYTWGFALPTAAEVLASTGEPQKAIEILDEFLSIVEPDNQKPIMAQCYRVKAHAYNQIATDPKKDDLILELLAKAKDITHEIGCNFQHPRIHLNYAEFYQRTGQADKAKENHQRALDYFQKYGMHAWYDYHKKQHGSS